MKFKKHNLIRLDYAKTGFRYSCKNCHIDYKTKPKNVCGAKIEEKHIMGKHSRAAGKRFELKVREDLEKDGWIVVRWDKNVEFTDDMKECLRLLPLGGEVPVGKLVRVKPKFNPFTKSLMMNSGGFPDFVCIRYLGVEYGSTFGVLLIECKCNGTLSKIEKEKVEWIKQNLKIPVFIASKGEKRGTINYERI